MRTYSASAARRLSGSCAGRLGAVPVRRLKVGDRGQPGRRHRRRTADRRAGRARRPAARPAPTTARPSRSGRRCSSRRRLAPAAGRAVGGVERLVSTAWGAAVSRGRDQPRHALALVLALAAAALPACDRRSRCAAAGADAYATVRRGGRRRPGGSSGRRRARGRDGGGLILLAPHAAVASVADRCAAVLAGAALPFLLLGRALAVGCALAALAGALVALGASWHSSAGATGRLAACWCRCCSALRSCYPLGGRWSSASTCRSILLPPPSAIAARARRIAADPGGRFRPDLPARGRSPATPSAAAPASWSRSCRPRRRSCSAGLLPLGNLVSALPIIGIAPIMVMWFGFDWQSKAAVVVGHDLLPDAGEHAWPGSPPSEPLRARPDALLRRRLLADPAEAAPARRPCRSSSTR